MQQIDTNKIKTMTSDRIAYTLYERNKIMKKKKLKKVLFSVVTCILLLGGITTVDALSQGKISNTLKNTVKVILIGDDNQKREMKGEQYVDENGDIWIKYKDNTDQNEIDVNKSELEKEELKTDIEINNDNGQGSIEIGENQNK